MNLVEKVNEISKTGKFFTVWFYKKDGSLRRMTARFGVTKHLRGGKKTVPDDKYFIVWDCGKQDYRAVSKDRICKVKFGGREYVENM